MPNMLRTKLSQWPGGLTRSACRRACSAIRSTSGTRCRWMRCALRSAAGGAEGAQRIGLIGFSAGGHLTGSRPGPKLAASGALRSSGAGMARTPSTSRRARTGTSRTLLSLGISPEAVTTPHVVCGYRHSFIADRSSSGCRCSASRHPLFRRRMHPGRWSRLLLADRADRAGCRGSPRTGRRRARR